MSIRTIAKWGAALTVVYAGLVFGFPTKETVYRCTGVLEYRTKSTDTTMVVKLQQYRPWVRLYSRTAGSARVEVPNMWAGYFEDAESSGDHIYIRHSDKRLAGMFSTLSLSLQLDAGLGIGHFTSSACSRV